MRVVKYKSRNKDNLFFEKEFNKHQTSICIEKCTEYVHSVLRFLTFKKFIQ